MRSLEDILNELNEAEKEYKAKCIKYGIEETKKKRKNNEIEEKDSEVE